VEAPPALRKHHLQIGSAQGASRFLHTLTLQFATPGYLELVPKGRIRNHFEARGVFNLDIRQ
jgi:hypothetical protein